MANLLDYLDWRGDISFEQDPFNEVDGLVLSEMAYIDFAGIVPEPGETPARIDEVCARYWEQHSKEELKRRGTLFREAPAVLEKLCSGKRFNTMRLGGYVNYASAEYSGQMAAVTCYLSDGTALIAFRGTDDTLVGWKEDFTFSFRKETDGQRSALSYLSRFAEDPDNPARLRVGGHSKGGNFAIYAAAFSPAGIRDRIQDVYIYDSPGFLEEITESEEYRSILPRVRSYVPEESVFGLLLETGYSSRVVKSSNRGVWQHDALSWKVMRNEFEKAEAVSERSILIENTIESWLRQLSMVERKEVVDIIFSALEDTGKENLSEITEIQFRTFAELLKAYWEMNVDEKRFLRQVSGKLLMNGAKMLSDELQAGLAKHRKPRLENRNHQGREKKSE